MICDFNPGDTIVLRPINQNGFICGLGKLSYFVSLISNPTSDLDADTIIVSLSQDNNLKNFIKIRSYQVYSVIDILTGIEKYSYDMSSAL